MLIKLWSTDSNSFSSKSLGYQIQDWLPLSIVYIPSIILFRSFSVVRSSANTRSSGKSPIKIYIISCASATMKPKNVRTGKKKIWIAFFFVQARAVYELRYYKRNLRVLLTSKGRKIVIWITARKQPTEVKVNERFRYGGFHKWC